MTETKFKRWVEGMKAVTPLQMSRINMISYAFILIGLLIGVFSAMNTKTWWLLVVLVGSLLVTLVAYLGLWQKHHTLKMLNKQMEANDNV